VFALSLKTHYLNSLKFRGRESTDCGLGFVSLELPYRDGTWEHSQLKQPVDVRGDMRELGSTQGFSPAQNLPLSQSVIRC